MKKILAAVLAAMIAVSMGAIAQDKKGEAKKDDKKSEAKK